MEEFSFVKNVDLPSLYPPPSTHIIDHSFSLEKYRHTEG